MKERNRLYVYVSPIPPSASVTRNRIPTAPLLPIYPGPQPVHAVCTSHTRRATPASRPYTSNATPTLTTLAMSEYASLSAVWASICDRIRASLSLITDLDSPATRWSNELNNLCARGMVTYVQDAKEVAPGNQQQLYLVLVVRWKESWTLEK